MGLPATAIPPPLLFHDRTDHLPYNAQYRTTKHLPGGRPLASSVKQDILYQDLSGSTKIRNRMPQAFPGKANSLPLELQDAPPLIDFDYWAEVNEKLRQKGKILPCDYIRDSARPAWMEYPETRSGCIRRSAASPARSHGLAGFSERGSPEASSPKIPVMEVGCFHAHRNGHMQHLDDENAEIDRTKQDEGLARLEHSLFRTVWDYCHCGLRSVSQFLVN